MTSTGVHCLIELYGCPRSLLDDEAFVTEVLRESVRCGFATLLHEVSHKFHPHGVTALALIAESHVAIHTWPEYGYVAADAFTCGKQADAEKACLYITEAFKAERHTLTKLARGGLPPSTGSHHPSAVSRSASPASGAGR